MTKGEIEEVRVELKNLLVALVDMARQNGEPITEIMQVQRDGPATIDGLCDLALKGLEPRPEAAALNLLDEAIQELGKHYAPKDVIATKEGMDGWNGAVGYCIGTILRMQDDRRGPQEER